MQMNRTEHPTKAHRGLPSQTQPLPTPPSEGLQSLSTEPHAEGWPDETSAGPEKKERDLSQRSGLAMKQLKNSQKGQAIKQQEEIPDLAALGLHPRPELVHPMPLSRSMPN